MIRWLSMPLSNPFSVLVIRANKSWTIQVKERPTVKNRLIIGQGKTIQYLSPYWCGKTHDYRILKEEFPPSINWFESFNIRLDLGYLSFDKDYACSTVYLSFKNRKTAPLTDEQKTINRGFASERTGTEYSTGILKRYRALSDHLRGHDLRAYDSTLEGCAGLCNFYLTTWLSTSQQFWWSCIMAVQNPYFAFRIARKGRMKAWSKYGFCIAVSHQKEYNNLIINHLQKIC